MWNANVPTHSKIVKKAEVFGTLTDRDYVVTGEEIKRGTFRWIDYDFTPTDKSEATFTVDKPVDLEVLAKAGEQSEEQMIALIKGDAS